MSGQLAIGALYDLWTATRWDVHEIRRRLNDPNLEPLVAEWRSVYGRSGPKADSVAHALTHVRALLPEGTLRLASTVTVEWLTERLYAYQGKPNTLRKVHSSWSQFFAYCTDVKGLYPANPMAKVTRPAVQGSPIRFYELDVVERIVAHQPTSERRALFAPALRDWDRGVHRPGAHPSGRVGGNQRGPGGWHQGAQPGPGLPGR